MRLTVAERTVGSTGYQFTADAAEAQGWTAAAGRFEQRGASQAGDFDARHLRIDAPGVDHFDVWAGGEDCVPVRLTSDGLRQTYELIAIEGDYC